MRYIIEIDDLNTLVESLGESLVVADVRNNREEGVISAAALLNVKEDISGKDQFFADPVAIAEKLGQVGINEEMTVVFIDNGTNRESAKALFALYQLGHRGGLHILQGGYPTWQAAGIKLAARNEAATTYNYDLRDNAVFTYEMVKEALADETVALIDSRSYERYAGLTEPKYKKAGHIPGAVNFHAKKAFDETGKWLKAAELEESFSSLKGKETVIASCGSGGSACLNAVALLEAGFEDVALYPGGYSEWLDKDEEVAVVEEVDKKDK